MSTTFRNLLLSGASLDEAYRHAIQTDLDLLHMTYPSSGAIDEMTDAFPGKRVEGYPMPRPIDTCSCDYHSLERSHRELTKATKCLVDAIVVTKALSITHINLVDAQHTLEQHGYKEKGE